ncbi:MAG: glycine--tRNA ligase subunit beta [Deltaproteobacteria bacterium]|nr:glycine--tRNA ligase subunit beta [Deltaproteobacteria bacterium]
MSAPGALDLILELGVEEIPASYFGPAMKYLEDRLTKELGSQRLPFSGMEVWGGPRRLALGLTGIDPMQPDVEEEIIGPPLSSAFDSVGNPTKAAQGFAKGQGVPISGILTLNTPKGPYLAVRRHIAGKPAGAILAQILPGILQSLPFPKVMRWGSGEYSFVRPVHWLLCVLGGEVLPISFAGIKAGKVSHGHRFLSPGAVIIASPSEYKGRLAESHVLVDFQERREAVLSEIQKAIRDSNTDLTPLLEPELVDEVANLVEEPVAILGRFDTQFLDLPRQVSATAMQEHQRYFPVEDNLGRQAPYFVAVNNTRARDMDVVRKGHERVLRARLEDARFYYVEDKKIPLSDRLEDLRDVVFHHDLGSYRDKVERVAELAQELAAELAPELRDTIRKASMLMKSDLTTGVVKEFPSLQGVMGREYALSEGESQEVADAIREQYLPVRAGGDLPATLPGAVLSVADKLDTICGCVAVNLQPSGSADPLALRRQALGIILIALDRKWGFSLETYVGKALRILGPLCKRPEREALLETLRFFEARLKSHILSQGISPDGAEAVLTLYANYPLSSLQRAMALENLKKREGFRDLAQTFKRVVNIIKKFGEKEAPLKESDFKLDAEKALLKDITKLEEDAQGYVRSGSFPELLDKIAALKAPVDKFFEDVLVDDPDPELKNTRIALLTRTSRLFELIADFSKVSSL